MRLTFLVAIALIALIMAGACIKPAATPPADTSGTAARTPTGSNETTPATGQEPPAAAGGPEGTSMSGQLPDKWPESVPVMEGLAVGTGVKIDGPPLIINVGLHGNVPMDDVQAFYTSLAGWERNPSLPWKTTGAERQFSLKSGEHEHLGVTIREDAGETKVLFVYGNDAG
jgi:hypothetical protein